MPVMEIFMREEIGLTNALEMLSRLLEIKVMIQLFGLLPMSLTASSITTGTLTITEISEEREIKASFGRLSLLDSLSWLSLPFVHKAVRFHFQRRRPTPASDSTSKKAVIRLRKTMIGSKWNNAEN